MSKSKPKYSKEEFVRRGDSIYTKVRPLIADANPANFIAIDIESGDFEVDSSEMSASDRVLARNPNAQIWLRRVGSRFARRFGPRGGGVVTE